MKKVLKWFAKYLVPNSKREWVEFCLNMLVGLAVFFFIGRFVGNETGQSLINTIFDGFIEKRMVWLANGKEKPESWSKIVFFDIDAKAVQSLEHPDIFPRGIIAALVRYAATHKAKVILVDMDLSTGDKLLYERSEKIKAYLAGVSEQAGDQMLIDVLKEIEEKYTNTTVLLPKMSYADQTAKSSFLARHLGAANQHILWASPHFYPSDADPYVRFWAPYVEISLLHENEEKEILWTMPFMAAALYGDALAEELEQCGKEVREGREKEFQFPWKSRKKESFCVIERNWEDDIVLPKDQRNRITFEFLSDNSPLLATTAYLGKMQEAEKSVHHQIYHWRKDSEEWEKDITLPIGYLRRTSKGDGGKTKETLDGNGIPFIDCEDKIVIIGRSDEDGNDLFWTPVDRMPGMYVHGNSIATLLPHGGKGLPHLAAGEWFLVCNVISLSLFSCIAVKYSSLWVWIWTIVLSWLTYMGFSFWFIAKNTFVYAGAASVAVTLFDTVNKPMVDWLQKRVNLS